MLHSGSLQSNVCAKVGDKFWHNFTPFINFFSVENGIKWISRVTIFLKNSISVFCPFVDKNFSTLTYFRCACGFQVCQVGRGDVNVLSPFTTSTRLEGVRDISIKSIGLIHPDWTVLMIKQSWKCNSNLVGRSRLRYTSKLSPEDGSAVTPVQLLGTKIFTLAM